MKYDLQSLIKPNSKSKEKDKKPKTKPSTNDTNGIDDTPATAIISGDKNKEDEDDEEEVDTGIKKVLSKKEKEKLKKERDKVSFSNDLRKRAKLHRFHRQRKRRRLPQRRPLKMIPSHHHHRLFQNPRQPHLQ